MEGSPQMDPIDLSKVNLVGALNRNAEGIADTVLVALRESAVYLAALRFAALAHQQGAFDRLDAALAPYLPEGTSGGEDEAAQVLDDPEEALKVAIEDGTPEEIRVKMVIDSMMHDYERAEASFIDEGDKPAAGEARASRAALAALRHTLTGE